MIDKILEKRKYVMDYDKNVKIDKSVIKDLLIKSWKVTPSKNNFMPYKIHVVGPKQNMIKHKIFKKCMAHEGYGDNVDVRQRYNKENLPNYRNILSCSHLMIFTLRYEPDPNPFQKWLIDRGHNYPAADKNRIHECYSIAMLEVGLFAAAFGALCLEQKIDSSFTGCFPSDITKWQDIPFVDQTPLMLMTVGKGKVYRQDIIQDTDYEKDDWKPDFNKVVNIL